MVNLIPLNLLVQNHFIEIYIDSHTKKILLFLVNLPVIFERMLPTASVILTMLTLIILPHEQVNYRFKNYIT